MANNAHSLSTPQQAEILRLWRAGQPVALPTETVYGLAVDACNDDAVSRVFALKGRPAHNPLIVHVHDVATVQRHVEWNMLAQKLTDIFWPGALTLVLPRRADSTISTLCSPGMDTLAIRCPAHPIARALLAAFGGPVAAPSANRSGRISPTCAQHVQDEFGDTLTIVDGGECEQGLESTVLKVNEDSVSILRPGSITHAQIEQAGITVNAQAEEQGALSSPGQLTSHYAPSLPVRMNAERAESGEAFLAFGETHQAEVLNLSPSGSLDEAARHLFAYLRELDDNAHYQAIAVAPIPEEGVGCAINDRLRRAAAPRG